MLVQSISVEGFFFKAQTSGKSFLLQERNTETNCILNIRFNGGRRVVKSSKFIYIVILH